MPDVQTSTAAAAAAAATTSASLAESSEKPSQHQNASKNSNPFLDIFSNFLKLFNLVLPPQKKNNRVEESSAAPQPTKVSPEVEAESKPAVVKFPRQKDESLPSLKLEPDEIEERNTNPVVLWQVYAIGGFLVLRWAWMRWNERRTRKKPSDEEPPPARD